MGKLPRIKARMVNCFRKVGSAGKIMQLQEGPETEQKKFNVPGQSGMCKGNPNKQNSWNIVRLSKQF
jgi:hypothetical protein